jgi:CubicO group peptidase (beta-lactamase class C family)
MDKIRADRRQVLSEKIAKTAEEASFSGVISIYENRESLFCRAFGYRDIENKLPNTTETLFGIASGTKLFTALGIGVLIDRGVLTLDTSVGSLSPEYRGFIGEKATILNLLTHTSGIYDYYDEENEQDFDDFFVEIPWYKLETPTDYLPLFVGKQSKFEPGERYSYSNGGFVFLGMIIEKLTGQRYRDFIQNEVLLPAGMNRSGFYAFNVLPENTAKGYLSDRKTTNIYNLPIRGGGDGGMYTTADDLNTFWEHFMLFGILSENLTKNYLQTYQVLNEKSGYGCGIYKRLDERMFFIVGGDAGVGFDSRYLMKEKTVVSILANVTDGEEAMRETVLIEIENGTI